MKRYAALCAKAVAVAVLTLAPLTMALADDDAKTVDPSGTWRWEHDEGGETVKNVTTLTYDGGKLTGSYRGRRGPYEIKNGKVDKNQVSFEFGVEADGRTYLVKFNGTVKGDEVTGDVSVDVDGETQQYPWSAKRALHKEDVVGIWDLKIETNDGNVLTPKLILSLDGDQPELKGDYKTTVGDLKLDVSDIEVKDNSLFCVVSGEFDGNSLKVQYKLKPRGDKISGDVEYDFNGDTGELKVEGKRDAKPKDKAKDAKAE